MRIIKKIVKYASIFVGVCLLLFLILITTSCIPRESIEEKLKESATFLKDKNGIEELARVRYDKIIHYYADSMLLNIIYCLDTDTPIKSTLWANYYEKRHMDVNDDFVEVVEEQKAPNQQYLRYWHGSMAIIRPLLLVFNIEQIYILNRNIIYNISWNTILLTVQKE